METTNVEKNIANKLAFSNGNQKCFTSIVFNYLTNVLYNKIHNELDVMTNYIMRNNVCDNIKFKINENN